MDNFTSTSQFHEIQAASKSIFKNRPSDLNQFAENIVLHSFNPAVLAITIVNEIKIQIEEEQGKMCYSDNNYIQVDSVIEQWKV